LKSVNRIIHWQTILTFGMAFAAATAIFLLLKPLGITSQNGFYHIELSRRIWDMVFSQPFSNLPFSQFSSSFIDQHLGYHLGLAFLSQFFSADLAPKAMAAACVSLGFLALSYFSSAKNNVINFSFYLGTFFLFFEFSERLFWDRPQSLTFLVVCLHLWNFTRVKSGEVKQIGWIRFLCGFICGLISFETLCLILFLELFTLLDKDRSFKQSSYLILGAVSTLFFFPFGFAKISYIVELLTTNILQQEKISEWSRGIVWSPLKQIYIGIVAFTFLDLFLSKKQKIWTVHGPMIIFFLLSLKIHRFEYLFFLYSILFINLVITEHLKSKTLQFLFLSTSLLSAFWFGFQSLSQFQGNAVTVHNSTSFSRWFKQMNFPNRTVLNFKWEYWSSLLYNMPQEKSVPGFSIQIYRQNPELRRLYNKLRYKTENWTISDWERIFELIEGRFFLIESRHKVNQLIGAKKWPLIAIYQDAEFILYEYYGLARSEAVYTENKDLARRCILGCAEPIMVRKVNEKQIDVQIPIPKEEMNFTRVNSNLGLFSIFSKKDQRWFYHNEILYQKPKVDVADFYSNEFYFSYPFYFENGAWVLKEKDLPTEDLHHATRNLALFIHTQFKSNRYELFYERWPNKLVTEGSRIRKIYPLWALCYYAFKQKQPELQITCKNTWTKVDRTGFENWELGSQAILGSLDQIMIENRLDLAAVDKILAHFDPVLGIWYDRTNDKKKPLQNAGYRFQVGEALVYLLSVPQSKKIPWLSREVDKYAEEFFNNKDIYSVRWFAEIIYRSAEAGLITTDKVGAWTNQLLDIVKEKHLYQYPKEFHLYGCYKNEDPAQASYNLNHHDLLILEGLSFLRLLKSITDRQSLNEISNRLRFCGLRQQVNQINFQKMGAKKNFLGSFRTLPSLNSARSDVQGHALIALTNEIFVEAQH
jgi:hypothetical protein